MTLDETKPIDFAKAVMQMMETEGLSLADVAKRLQCTPIWLAERIDLLKLHPSIQEKLTAGELPLTNAYALSKIPFEAQLEYLPQALTCLPAAFVPMTSRLRIKA